MNEKNYEKATKEKCMFLERDMLDIKNEKLTPFERQAAAKHARKLIGYFAGFVFEGKNALAIAKLVEKENDK